MSSPTRVKYDAAKKIIIYVDATHVTPLKNVDARELLKHLNFPCFYMHIESVTPKQA